MRDHGWQTWLIVALLLAAAEMATLDLTLLMMAVGAGVGCILCALGLQRLGPGARRRRSSRSRCWPSCAPASSGGCTPAHAPERPAGAGRQERPRARAGHRAHRARQAQRRGLVGARPRGVRRSSSRAARSAWPRSTAPPPSSTRCLDGSAVSHRSCTSAARRPTGSPRGGRIPCGVLIILGIVVLLAIVVLVKAVRIVPQAYAGIVERFGKYRTTLSAGPEHRHAVRRPGALPHRPARAGGVVPAAAGDHRGQPGGLDRHRHLLPGHQPGRRRRTRSPTTSRRSSSSP